MTNFMVSGNVSRAAKTRMATTPSGQQTLVTDFNVAVNDGNGDSAIVTYYKVTLWGQRGANLAPYLTLGKDVDVTGVPGQEKAWIGQDGQAHSGALVIRRAQVQLRGKKAVTEPVADENELPFTEDAE